MLGNKITPLNRKETRKAIVALVDANVSTFVATYDHETTDFGRQSPIMMCYSDGTAAPTAPRMEQHAFIVSIWWRRDAAQDTEDYIDDLSEELRTLLKNNASKAGDWASLTIDDGFSSMDYPIVDGVMYRRESLRVIVW